MTIVEMYELIQKIYENNETEYRYIGLRFENKQRTIGDICENSKHNQDREDERNFPEFGSEEYDDLYELDGTSAWNLETDDKAGYGSSKFSSYDLSLDDCTKVFEAKHCYVIASDRAGYESDEEILLDENEILIKDAKVIAQIF